jgi:chaperonin cofactor prefoldin
MAALIALEKDDTEENLTSRLEAVKKRIKVTNADMRVIRDELETLKEIEIIVNAKLKMLSELEVLKRKNEHITA